MAVGRSNVAVTVVSAVSVTVHDPVPKHPPPLQPMNTELPPARASTVTVVPGVYVSEQSTPQAIRLSELMTAPVPAPALATVSV